MNRQDTTRILIHNLATNELILVANKRVLADYFHVNWHSVVDWFRDASIIKRKHEGCSYLIYKPEYYLAK